MASPRQAAHTAQGRQSLRLSLLGTAVAALLITATSAQAQTGASTPRQFDIPASPLVEALDRFGEQSGLQVSYGADLLDLLRSKPAPAVNGKLSPDAALKQLLQGSGLESGYVNARTVVIKKAEPAPAKPKAKPQPQSRATPAAEEEAMTNMPAIMVTGTRTLNMDIHRTQDDIQPYVIFDREAIEESGAANLEMFFKQRLTMSTASSSASQGAGAAGNISQINLRGLGSDETLILIDGRRIAGINFIGTPSQPDLNAIPLAAIERIEVLPTTASGIYGGGATGGVINIVLRRDYSGVDATLYYGNTFESDVASRRIEISGGASSEDGKTSIIFFGSYANSNKLLAQERNFIERGRRHILEQNPNFFLGSQIPPLGATPNIRSSTGENLVLKDGTQLNSPITYIPYGYPGAASDGGRALVNNAGKFNLDPAHTAQGAGGEKHGLLNNPTVKSAALTIRKEITPSIQSFLELDVHNNVGRFPRNQVNIFGFIPSSAQNNPFTQDILVSVPTIGADDNWISEHESHRAVVGFILRLSDKWKAGLDYSWNRSRLKYKAPGGASPQVAANVNNGTIDVLRDINSFPVSFLPYGPPDQAISPTRTVLRSTSVRVAGPLPFSLPAGDVTVSASFEHRDESYGDIVLSLPTVDLLMPNRSQSVDSAYIEALVPVLPPVKEMTQPALELQLAMRRDEYKVSGTSGFFTVANPTRIVRTTNKSSSVDPTFGVRYQPIKSLVLRASYGTGYLPPSVSQLVPTPSRRALASHLVDPLRGNEPLGEVTFTGGGNPELKPEKSESWSAGLVFTPDLVNRLRFSADWSIIKKTDNIVTVTTGNATQSVFDNEEFVQGLITRAPRQDGDPYTVGPVIGISTGLFNIAKLHAEAIDLALEYQVDSQRVGGFNFAARATKLLSLETQLTPLAPVVENAGAASAFGGQGEGGGLEWKASGSLTWRSMNWMLGWSISYFDDYYLNTDHAFVLNQGAAKIGSQTYHDLFGKYTFDGNGRNTPLFNGVEIRFGINNIFNKLPPIDVESPQQLYYSPWGDPRLANYYISVRKSFGGNR